MWDFPCLCICLVSTLLLYMLLIPSFISLSSLTILLNDIVYIYVGLEIYHNHYVRKKEIRYHVFYETIQ
jgi:hypothetical protein